MFDAKDLIRGGYDLHVHSAPDVLPRKMNDIEMARRIEESGMAGYAIKSHLARRITVGKFGTCFPVSYR